MMKTRNVDFYYQKAILIYVYFTSFLQTELEHVIEMVVSKCYLELNRFAAETSLT